MAADKRSLHEKRGISFAELGALLGTREMLKRGLLVEPKPGENREAIARQGAHIFRMRTSCAVVGCGSVACIGGTMGMVMGLNGNDSMTYVASRRSPSLKVLFYPPEALNWNSITPKRAVKAIDNWLAGGDPKWRSIPGVKRD